MKQILLPAAVAAALFTGNAGFAQGVPTVDVKNIAQVLQMLTEAKLQLKEQILQNMKLDEQTLKLLEQIKVLREQYAALTDGLTLQALNIDPKSFLSDVLPTWGDLTTSPQAREFVRSVRRHGSAVKPQPQVQPGLLRRAGHGARSGLLGLVPVLVAAVHAPATHDHVLARAMQAAHVATDHVDGSRLPARPVAARLGSFLGPVRSPDPDGDHHDDQDQQVLHAMRPRKTSITNREPT